MDLGQLSSKCLQRVPEKKISLRDIRWLAEVDIDFAELEERWGSPENVSESLVEWICFAFSPEKGEAFFLQREVDNPPTPLFGLSVTTGLFSAEAANQIVKALGVAGARVTQVNPDAIS